MILRNTLFDTNPIIVHANGPHIYKRYWNPIKEKVFASPGKNIGPVEDLTIVTFNNGHEAMGMLERCLDHLGVPYAVYGQGIEDWVNSVHKPEVILEAAQEINSKYIMGLDSRDVLVLDDPHILLEQFVKCFDCELVFAGDRFNWPNLKEFKRFEDSIAPREPKSEFKYVSWGCWIGTRDFILDFFAEAVKHEPVPQAPESEQGILKKVFPDFYPRVQIDYYCKLFQNIGYLATPILEF